METLLPTRPPRLWTCSAAAVDSCVHMGSRGRDSGFLKQKTTTEMLHLASLASNQELYAGNHIADEIELLI
jgi:hypothetical protein